MTLLTLNDLLSNPPELTEPLVAKAKGLCNVYEDVLSTMPDDTHGRAPGLHASEISGCERRIVYSLIGMKREERNTAVIPSPIEKAKALNWKKRFKIGHAVHEMFQKDFHKMARAMNIKGYENWHISFEDEVPIAPHYQDLAKKWFIWSHCDGVFVIRERWDGPAILRIALEIKTESPAQWEKLKGPKANHIEQAHVYMACLDVPLTWFLYYNKGNQNYTSTDSSYLIKFDPEVWRKLEAKFERMHEHAANVFDSQGNFIEANLPPREESVVCEFCAFSDTCSPAYLNKNNRRPTWQAIRGPNE
jgi:hypothetical protein